MGQIKKFVTFTACTSLGICVALTAHRLGGDNVFDKISGRNFVIHRELRDKADLNRDGELSTDELRLAYEGINRINEINVNYLSTSDLKRDFTEEQIRTYLASFD